MILRQCRVISGISCSTAKKKTIDRLFVEMITPPVLVEQEILSLAFWIGPLSEVGAFNAGEVDLDHVGEVWHSAPLPYDL